MNKIPFISAEGNYPNIAEKISKSLFNLGANRIISYRHKIIYRLLDFNNKKYNVIIKKIKEITKRENIYCYLEAQVLSNLMRSKEGEIIGISGFSDFIDLLKFNIIDEECSSFIQKHDDQSNDWIACGQTWDTKKFYQQHVVLIKRAPEEAYSTLSLTTFLGGAYFGINEKGVGILSTNVKSKDVKIGLPFSIIIYKALERSSTAIEAIEIIKNAPRMNGHNYIIVDSIGNAFNIETTARYHSLTRIKDKEIYVHTNDLIDKKLLKYGISYSPSSPIRKKVLYEKMESLNSPLNNDILKTIFSDHTAPICRYGRTDDEVSTIGAVWLKPKRRAMIVIFGNPCSNNWKEYILES